MGTRFGRRSADGTFEYHDSKDSLASAERKENSEVRADFFGFIGLLIGGLLSYLMLLKLGSDWPKWLRFGLVIFGAVSSSYILAKLADLLWAVLLSLALIGIVYGLGSLIWKVV